MATIEELVVTLTAETQGLRTELTKATEATKQATDKMNESLASMSKKGGESTGFLQSALATMAGFIGGEAILGAFEKLKEAAEFLWQQFEVGIEVAGRNEVAFVRLANALSMHGHYTQEVQADLEEFSHAMEKQTGLEKSAIASNMALIASLTRLDSEGLKKAESAAIDFSAALGIDLDTANRLVAKGIEGNVGAFKRYGISIREGGSEAENFKNVLQGLSTFTGAASAQANTYEGQIRKLNNSYEDLLGTLGKTITQNPVILAIIQSITDEINKLAESADENGDSIAEGLGGALVSIIELMETALVVTSELVDVWRVLESVAETIVLPLFAVGEAFMFIINTKDNIINGFKDIREQFALTTATFDRIGDNLGENKNSIDKMIPALDNIREKAALAYAAMKAGTESVGPGIENNTNSIGEMTEMQKLLNESIKEFVDNLVKASMNSEEIYKSQVEQLKEQLKGHLVSYDDYWAEREVQLQQQHAEEQGMLDNARAQGLISEQKYVAATGALKSKQANEDHKMQTEKKISEDQYNKLILKSSADMFGNLATLSESSNKTLAGIGKASALAQATIQGYLAIQNALAEVPYPLNFVAAATVGVATAVNIAKISGVGFERGIDEVPGVGHRDSFPAMLAPGERVVPSETNQDLKRFLDGQGEGSGNISITVSLAGATIIGDLRSAEFGAAVVQAINEALRSGRTTGIYKNGAA